MAILEIFAVRDVISDTYGRPFYSPNVASGVRSITMEVNNAHMDNMLHTHPDDFELYHLGQFNDATGTFEPFQQPKFLLRMSSVSERHAAVKKPE